MANREALNVQQHNVEVISYDEIEELEVLGKGAFGVVSKGLWKGEFVAIKHVASESEIKAFRVEVRQLSRVNHPNIVRLYGAACKALNRFCLVMEYAEGGSLDNVLHCRPLATYTAGHAISWALQCARGVAYLHNMKPKPIIHRDLKPLNLLLVTGGTVLKIGDFGTACDKTTSLTNNKGSAAWMAPEVFSTTKYTEKCDVFSWGIILWEVISRRKPFEDFDDSALRVLWAVHNGKRPPLIDGCPKPIEKLYTRCWDQNPSNRPSMEEVVRIMTLLFTFFSGHDKPIEYCDSPDSVLDEIDEDEEEEEEEDDTENETADSQSMITDEAYLESLRTQKGSLNGSLLSQEGDETLHDNKYSRPLQIHVEPGDGWDAHNGSQVETPLEEVEIHGRAGLDKVLTLPPQEEDEETISQTVHEELDNIYLMLDPELHPVPPDKSCQQSVEIFEEHKHLAKEYLKVQTDMAYLSKHMKQLAERLTAENQEDNEDEEVRKLESEKESLIELHRNLKRQLELLRQHRRDSSTRAPPTNDGWVVVPHHSSRQHPS